MVRAMLFWLTVASNAIPNLCTCPTQVNLISNNRSLSQDNIYTKVIFLALSHAKIQPGTPNMRFWPFLAKRRHNYAATSI